MKTITSSSSHGGWELSSALGLKYAIKSALATELNYLEPDQIILSPLRLLPSTPNTFTFKAQVGTRVLVGTAKVEVAATQDCGLGSENISTFVRVCYGKGIDL